MRFFAVSLVWLFLLFWKSYIKEIDQGSYGFTRSKFISKHFYKKNITKDNSSRDHLKILFDDLINIATTLSYLDTKITDLLINVFFFFEDMNVGKMVCLFADNILSRLALFYILL